MEKIFEAANVKLRLHHTVTDVTKTPKHRYYIHSQPQSHAKSYDVVVVATPLWQSKIKFIGVSKTELRQKVPMIKYRTVHVSFLWGLLNPKYFGKTRKELEDIGTLITTNYHDVPFRSIGRFGTDKESCTRHYSGCYHLYKFFAGHEMHEEIGGNTGHDGIMRWFDDDVNRFEWKAYPLYEGRAKLGSFVLDDAGFFYVNAIEGATSAMEVLAVGGRNVAHLALDYLGLTHISPNEHKAAPIKGEL